MRSTILCVDDEKVLLNVLAEQLQSWFGENYNIEKALSGEEALEIIDECIANDVHVSVVISDYIMPVMKGDELLAKINEKDPKIKKIMLTGYSSIEGIIHAINKAGLYRFISKPWDNKDLMLTLLEAIKAYEHDQVTLDLARKYEVLNDKYQKLLTECENNVNNMVEILAKTTDSRSISGDGHCKRVAQYAGFIGKSLKLDKKETKNLIQAALLHDVGKLAISDEELADLRKSRLNNSTNSEIRKKQTEASEDLLKTLLNYDEIIDGIKYQFEEYAGSGIYGLSGEKIPLNARIIAIANEFDFLKNKIDQKLTLDQIIDRFERSKSVIFDPKLVNIFIEIVRPTIK